MWAACRRRLEGASFRALNAGADEYLMKPFDGAALGEKLAILGLVETGGELSYGG